MDDETAWAMAYAAELGLRLEPGTPVRWVESGSGARLAFCGDIVLKLHDERTVPADLERRHAAAAAPGLPDLLVQPLAAGLKRSPGGRLVSAWPRVDVLSPDTPVLPWAEAGALLARLHSVRVPPGLPGHGGRERIARAARRAQGRDWPKILRDLGEHLVTEAGKASERHTGRPVTVVHGDWHLGQLAQTSARWRLIDLDDLGAGDPAWDLARPAGFWAAGLLEDASWEVLLGAYRGAGGTAVPTTGDPWPALDLPARCAVFVAAVRELRHDVAGHSSDTARNLLAACARM